MTRIVFFWTIIVSIYMSITESSVVYGQEIDDKQTEVLYWPPSTTYKLLELSYLTLNTIDLVTTFYSLGRGAKEFNPIARKILQNRPLAVLIKGGLSLGVLYGLRQVHKENKIAAYVTLSLITGFYSYVATNNIVVSFQVSR